MPIFHGIKVNQLADGARTLNIVATAVIGLVATSASADAQRQDAIDAMFPLDRPVLLTDLRTALSTAGEGGTLLPALEAIADQVSPTIVVVRVAEGADAAETEANVLGGIEAGQYLGLEALLAAESNTAVRPRILGAPGLDTVPVREALVAVAQKLRGFVYARAFGDDVAGVVAGTAAIDMRELMLIWPDFGNAVGDVPFAGDAVARAMGLRAKIDEEIGWHKTISNVTIAGTGALTKDVYFDLQDPSTTAAVLNDKRITTMVRLGAIRFWGNRTMAADPVWAFESRVRTSQALQDTIAEGLALFVDVPLSAQTARDIIETINALFRRLKAEGRIIGGEMLRIDPAQNSPEALAAGRLVLDYEFTDIAPLEGLTLNARVSDRFYADFAGQIARL